MPDFSIPFCLETDASNSGVGAVLLQQGHPLAFISKPLGIKTQGLSTYEKEYLALVLAVDQWRPYLQQAEFIIYTDQKSLIHLNEQRLNTPWQQKLFTTLLGLQYKIIYKKGCDNSVAGALSRRPHPDHLYLATSVSSPKWLEDIATSYQSDPRATELITKLSVDPTADPDFSFRNGLLRYKNKLWVGSDPAQQLKFVEALHCSPVGGHSGVPVTLSRLKQYFAWTRMKTMVHSFVSSCQICQQAKPDRAKYPGLLQPLPVPYGAWQTITMDFVEGLPKSGSYDTILVIVDKFSKYSHFIHLAHPFTAASVARLFMTNVYKLHGMPVAIVSDRDRVFTSQLWQELFKLAGVRLLMSTSYHPQRPRPTAKLNASISAWKLFFIALFMPILSNGSSGCILLNFCLTPAGTRHSPSLLLRFFMGMLHGSSVFLLPMLIRYLICTAGFRNVS